MSTELVDGIDDAIETNSTENAVVVETEVDQDSIISAPIIVFESRYMEALLQRNVLTLQDEVDPATLVTMYRAIIQGSTTDSCYFCVDNAVRFIDDAYTI